MGSMQNVAVSRLALINALPKAELHVHIEGTLEPQLMFDLAVRNDVLHVLPYKSAAEAKAAYNFHNLQSFLDLYYAGCAVLLTKQDFYDLTWAYLERAAADRVARIEPIIDFYDLTWAYLERAAADRVAHVELFFDPQSHTERGVPFLTALAGIRDALAAARAKLGISSHVIMCFLRHLGPDAAMATLLEALPHKGLIVGVGLDSAELGNPCPQYQAVFERAASEGLKCVAHAGEEGPAQYIWDALRILKVQRIDHGVKCLEDASLVAYLREHRVPLTVCPLSNLKLKVYDGELVERMRELLSCGLCITLNSDDPSYFGGYIGANYAYVANALDLGHEELYQLACNGFEASFLGPEELAAYQQQLAAAYQEATGSAAPASKA